MTTAITLAELQHALTEIVGRLIGLPPADVDVDAYLDELGLSSRDAVVLAGELEQLLDTSVAPTIAWEAPTVRQLAVHLVPLTDPPDLRLVPAARDVPAAAADDRVAIVGLGCRLPGGVDGPDAFWRLLREGRDVVDEVPPGRWERAGVTAGEGVPRHGAFLDDISGFDAEWFGISPREAALMDPQQRLLLETSVDALRHARLDPQLLRGTRTGVYVGISGTEYATLTTTRADGVEFWTATGGAMSIAANRISYALDLRGPSMALDSACSSSLAALHSAAVALRAGDCTLALAGGVNVLLTPWVTAAFERGGVLAADGRCKSFAAGADGIGRGEGCGVVVLERLADARANGHHVLAVIAGSAINSDGRSNGLTAPNAAAQEDVLRRAYEAAGVEPATVDYVEAHGTGTPLGDPVEAGALGRVLGAGRHDRAPLLLGSVKSNLGHLEAAAGVVSVIKVVLALQHDLLPATLHAATPNPHLTLERDHLELLTDAGTWPRYGGVARAGVSGFGFGGTNAHVVLEQAPLAPRAATPERGGVAGRHLFAVGGRTPERARATAARLADWLADQPGAGHEAVAATARSLAHGTDEGPHRVAVAAADPVSAAAALRLAEPVSPRSGAGSPVFVFAGYGQQWDGMASELMASEPAFADAADAACAALARHGVADIDALLRLGRTPADMVETMAALFAVQVGLSAWWRAAGVEPVAVLGQSLGEVAAAVVAGAVSLDDGARIMAVRARLLAGIDAQDAGAMAVLDLAADDLPAEPEWSDVEVAVRAAPSQCTVAGPADQVHRLVDRVEADGRDAWLLPVAVAGHTPAVDPVLPPLRAQLADLPPAVAQLDWYGTVLDDPHAPPAFDGGYWAANARRPVRLADAIAAALGDGHTTFVEISAHPVAGPALRRTVDDLRAAGELTGEQAERITVLASLRRDDDTELARAAATLHAAGHPGVLRALEPDGPRVDLPPVPWLRRDHWFRPAAGAALARPATTSLPAGAVLADGAVQVWTSDLVDLPGPAAPLDIATAAALADAAARASGVSGTVSAVDLDTGGAAAVDGGALLSCTRTDAGAEVELLHRAGGPDAAGWVRRVHARVSAGHGVLVPDTAAAAMEPAAAAPIGVAERLQAIFADVLGAHPELDHLDPDVPLVDVGLDSLMATRARHAVEHQFGVSLPARLLVQGTTLRGLADLLAVEAGAPAPAADTDAADTTAGPVAGPVEAFGRVGPRDPAERFLAAVVRRELDDETIGVTDDLRARFATAGATVARRVHAAVRDRIGDCPDAVPLLAAGSVEAMADLVRAGFDGGADANGAPDGPVRRLRTGSAPYRPLFVFHPAGATCAVYRPLLDQLDPRWPVVGFDRLDLGDDDSVPARAARYLDELRRIAPHGPYRLLGWSFGGLLAGECAHRLLEAGEEVELLASIDTTLPLRADDASETAHLTERFGRFAEHLRATYGVRVDIPEGIAEEDDRTQLRLLREAMLAAGVRLPAGVLRHQLTSYADARLAEHYRPPAWPRGMVLYRARQVEELTAALDPRYHRTDPALGWDEVAAELDIVGVPGDHITMIDRPNVDVLAHDLGERLTRLDRGPVAAGRAAAATPSGGDT